MYPFFISSGENVSDFWFFLIALFAVVGFLLRVGRLSLESRLMAYLLSLFCLWSLVALSLQDVISRRIIAYGGWLLVCLAATGVAGWWMKDLFNAVYKRWVSRRQSLLPQYLEETANAMVHMMHHKVGALIIIQGRKPLQPFLKSSIPFTSEIKTEVIISLFSPPSLVHDGAMIISNGRIVALKAVLPIGGQKNFPMGVGTRHRSAYSIAELSDAIALVVSEERREMSVMANGCWEKVISREELVKLIRAAIRGKKPFRSRRVA